MTGETPAEFDPIEHARLEAARLAAEPQSATPPADATPAAAITPADSTPKAAETVPTAEPTPIEKNRAILDAANKAVGMPENLVRAIKMDSQALNTLSLDDLQTLGTQIETERDRQTHLLDEYDDLVEDPGLDQRQNEIGAMQGSNIRALDKLRKRIGQALETKKREQEASVGEIQAEYLVILAEDFGLQDADQIQAWEKKNVNLSRFLMRTARLEMELKKLKTPKAAPANMPAAAPEPLPPTAPTPPTEPPTIPAPPTEVRPPVSTETQPASQTRRRSWSFRRILPSLETLLRNQARKFGEGGAQKGGNTTEVSKDVMTLSIGVGTFFGGIDFGVPQLRDEAEKARARADYKSDYLTAGDALIKMLENPAVVLAPAETQAVGFNIKAEKRRTPAEVNAYVDQIAAQQRLDATALRAAILKELREARNGAATPTTAAAAPAGSA